MGCHSSIVRLFSIDFRNNGIAVDARLNQTIFKPTSFLELHYESETNQQPISFNLAEEFCRPVLPHNQILCLHHFNLRSLYFQSLQSLPNRIQLQYVRNLSNMQSILMNKQWKHFLLLQPSIRPVPAHVIFPWKGPPKLCIKCHLVPLWAFPPKSPGTDTWPFRFNSRMTSFDCVILWHSCFLLDHMWTRLAPETRCSCEDYHFRSFDSLTEDLSIRSLSTGEFEHKIQ